jgi:hypothetical protein
MAGIKKRGLQSVQNHRTWRGLRVRPTLWVRPGGKHLMTGTVIDTDEIVRDSHGQPVPWQQIH